jgi:uncharacterized membrane protein YkgB
LLDLIEALHRRFDEEGRDPFPIRTVHLRQIEARPMSVPPALEGLDHRITRWMAKHGVFLLRISVGVVFFWFGFLKFFPGASPAEELATRTIAVLSAGRVPGSVALPVLATWESLIGLGLLTGRGLRVTILLLMVQMVGTVAPLVLFPELTFQRPPFLLTLEGQYIVKNMVLISAALVIGATVRGGRLDPEPDGLVKAIARFKTGG